MTDLSNLVQQAEGIQDRMEEVLDRARSARREQAEAQVEFERVRDRFTRWMAKQEFEFKNQPEVQLAVDPHLDEPTEEFSQSIVQNYLEGLEEYHDRKEEFWRTKSALEEANMKHVNATEELGVLKSRAALISAILKYGGE